METLNSVPTSDSKLGTRINAAAKLYGSRKNAANAAGVSVDMLARYIRNENQPSFDAIAKLCVGQNVSIAWLATGEGEMRVNRDRYQATADDVYLEAAGDEAAIERNIEREERASEYIKNINKLVPQVEQALELKGVFIDNHWKQLIANWVLSNNLTQKDIEDLGALIGSNAGENTQNDDYAYITLYDAECSAGAGSWNEECKPLTQLAFTKYSLRKKGLDANALSAIRVTGDSMEGDLSDGDAVLVDHSKIDVKGEGIYVIRLGGHLYAKRLQRTFDGVEIISTNKAYKSMHVPENQLNDLDVIGQVVWAASWTI